MQVTPRRSTSARSALAIGLLALLMSSGCRVPFFGRHFGRRSVPSPVHVPGPGAGLRPPGMGHLPRPGHAPSPGHFRAPWVIATPAPVVVAGSPTVNINYVPSGSLMLSLGDPTIGTDSDIIGGWALDADRSAAILGAYTRHLYQAYGSDKEPDMSKIRENLEKGNASLTLTADHHYTLHYDANGDNPTEYQGKWKFNEGVLDLELYQDVDGIPVKAAGFYSFNYYSNDKFTGLVVVNHSFGLAFKRG